MTGIVTDLVFLGISIVKGVIPFTIEFPPDETPIILASNPDLAENRWYAAD